MSNRATICVLGPEDIELLKMNIALSCCDHPHVRKLDAMEMTGRGDFKPYFTPIAEWVGPRHIRLLSIKSLRDKSAKLGEYLNKRVRQRVDWALTMEAEIGRHYGGKEDVGGDAGPYV